MPSYKTKTLDTDGNPVFKDIAFPITKEFREALYGKILEGFEIGEEMEFDWR
ncbi:SpoVG [Butyrivibrio fibrisolvens 16/4]|nr:SpoVG [Butyrivibrio fibrisolvens 16/4]